MRYAVYATWHGFAILRWHKISGSKYIAVFDDVETADAVCRDLNRHAE
jgi:hypothetical protein